MGDVLSLIEKAEQGLDAAETERLAQRIVSQEFTLETCATSCASCASSARCRSCSS